MCHCFSANRSGRHFNKCTVIIKIKYVNNVIWFGKCVYPLKYRCTRLSRVALPVRVGTPPSLLPSLPSLSSSPGCSSSSGIGSLSLTAMLCITDGRRSVGDGGTGGRVPPTFQLGGQHRKCPPTFSDKKTNLQAYSDTDHSSLLKHTLRLVVKIIY